MCFLQVLYHFVMHPIIYGTFMPDFDYSNVWLPVQLLYIITYYKIKLHKIFSSEPLLLPWHYRALALPRHLKC